MDRRRQPRLAFAVEVEIQPDDAAHARISATTQDICTTGLLVRGVPTLPIGALCTFSVNLSSGDVVVPIRGRGEVVRQSCDQSTGDQGVALRFTELEDGSQDELWRVIRYNSTDG